MLYKKISLSKEDPSVYLETYVADSIRNDGHLRRALLVIPGGGYGGVAADREGEPIAMAFLPHDFNAFVLHYSTGEGKTFPTQLIEATLAIKHIKDHAEEYHIDPHRLYTVGFSAGGHLAACTGVLWKHPAIYEAVDMPWGYNKPRGTMLIYPVLSPDHHDFSFHHLLGTTTPTTEQLDEVDILRHVDSDSAPAFLLHTADDPLVDVRNSLSLANALTDAGHKFELHIYPSGPHGLALANEITCVGNPAYIHPEAAKWVELAVAWMKSLD